jgi:hypothetical protein
VDIPVTINMDLERPDVQNAMRPRAHDAAFVSRIAGVGTAVTGEYYSQLELPDIFQITDPNVFDSTMRTAVVNSLFGDGATTIALIADPGGGLTAILGAISVPSNSTYPELRPGLPLCLQVQTWPARRDGRCLGRGRWPSPAARPKLL